MTDLAYAFEHTPGDEGRDRFTWSVVGPYGGVHIWAQITPDRPFGDAMYGGVECHWPIKDGEPHFGECWLLNGPCRHDGSSLYFSERIAPVLTYMDLHGTAARSFVESELFDWYRSHIAPREDRA